MSNGVFFKAIGNTDTNALPVKEIGLAVIGQNPKQANCWFSIGNVNALWSEYGG